jgi:hypothetical protein
MSIRSNVIPSGADLAPELQTILARNGLQAHLILQDGAWRLAVQGHDSPLLTYPVTEQQRRQLASWGTNSANRAAYNTLAALVGNDFYVPRNFVHARNANGRVAMGLHGYRIGTGEYGRMLGWTPRQQEGFHLRRVEGALFTPGAPMVADRPDGRMKPGELQNGGYGFYWKGNAAATDGTAQAAAETDVLKDLQGLIAPVDTRTVERPAAEAKPYNELITSPVYFTSDLLKECLDSHGIRVDAQSRTLTMQSSATDRDLVYDLTEAEVDVLTSPSIKNHPLEERLKLLNNITSADFERSVTMDTLNSRRPLDIPLHPEVEAQLAAREETQRELSPLQTIVEEEDRSVAHVDGRTLSALNENKGWYREAAHGREVDVADIRVEQAGKDKYRMTAVINGEAVTHEISHRQYEKFVALDDYHRMKLFGHIFPEVDMKTVPGRGGNALMAMLAGLHVAGEVAHDIGHLKHAPEVYAEHYADRPHVYAKAGVDSPQDIAARAFDAGWNAAEHGVGVGHQR